MSSTKLDKPKQNLKVFSIKTQPYPSSSFESLAEPNISPSPDPPKFLKWASPPSPFLFPVLVSSFSKSLLLTSNPKDLELKRKSLFTDAKGDTKNTNKTTTFLKAQNKAKKSKDSKSLIPLFTTESSLAMLASKTSSAFFDPEIALFARKDSFLRKKRPVQIVKPGTFEKSANALRARLISIDLEKEGGANSDEETDEEFGYFHDGLSEKDVVEKKENGDKANENGNCGVSVEIETFLEKIEKKKEFNVEWWDRELLKNESYDLGEDNIVILCDFDVF